MLVYGQMETPVNGERHDSIAAHSCRNDRCASLFLVAFVSKFSITCKFSSRFGEMAVVEIVAMGSTGFNKLVLYVVESKESPEGSAPEPKAVSGLSPKIPVFNNFRFQRFTHALLSRVDFDGTLG